jgi:hypothetical protein
MLRSYTNRFDVSSILLPKLYSTLSMSKMDEVCALAACGRWRRPCPNPFAGGSASAPCGPRRQDGAAAPLICVCAGTYTKPTSAIANAVTKTLRTLPRTAIAQHKVFFCLRFRLNDRAIIYLNCYRLRSCMGHARLCRCPGCGMSFLCEVWLRRAEIHPAPTRECLPGLPQDAAESDLEYY